MSELTTLARPYAKAIFEVARDTGQMPAWSEQLAAMSTVAHDPAMRAFLDNPTVSREDAAAVFIDVCEDRIDAAGRNFLRLLAENGRLGVLPEITALYEVMRSEAEGKLEARVVSAQPVTAAQQAAIAEALKARLGREVDLVCETDETLIGGAVIRAGDLVIDGSVRGRLERLAANLSR